MKKIDDILNGLQGQQPDVSNPGEWTDSMMAGLPDLPAEQPKPARRVRLYVASAITVAASLLLLLTLQFNHDIEPDAQQPLVAEKVEPQTGTAKTEVMPEIEETPVVAQVTPVKPARKARRRNVTSSPAPHTEAPPIASMAVADPAEQIEREYRAEANAIRQRGDQVMLHVAMLSEQQMGRMQYVEF